MSVLGAGDGLTLLLRNVSIANSSSPVDSGMHLTADAAARSTK